MPEHLKALVYILVLAVGVFAFARAPATALAMSRTEFERRRNLWFAVTLTAFLAHNFWVYIIIAGILLYRAQMRETNRLALYFFLLFALPTIPAEISGLGVISMLFEIDYVRLLALTVLLPAYLSLRKKPETTPFGRLLPDKLLAASMVLTVALMFEHRTITSILRDGFFYAFIDIFLPYYVASRALRSMEEFRNALMSFAIAGMVLSAVLFLEFARPWLLYSSLEKALGAVWGWNEYLVRGSNLLRSTGTIGHAIAAGYVVAITLGIYLYLRRAVPSRAMWYLGFAVLVAGLIGPISRGPWVGAVLMIVVFIVSGPAPVVGLAKLGLLILLSIPVLLGTSFGGVIIDHLPWVGTVDARTVAGRQLLAEVSYQVFWESPLLGRYDFVFTPAMQALRGDDGNVDLVNTYVVVALGRGLVGLTIFVGFFVAVMFGIFRSMRSLGTKDDERFDLGRSLLAALCGILLIIATVSPVLRVPLLYWISAGLGVAYTLMLAKASSPATGGAVTRVAPARAAASNSFARLRDER